MRTRLALATLLCALLAAGAGCAALTGGGVVDREALNQSASYDWETNATVTYNVTGTQYQGVVNVSGDSTVPVYINTEIEGEQPVPIAGLRFRYPNGTVANASTVGVEETDSRVLLTPPADGQIAYTAPAGDKTFSAPAGVNGSYEVVLPERMRVGAFLFSSVSPGGHTAHTSEATDRTTIRWERLDGGLINVRYYFERDIDLFLGLVALLAGAAAGGVIYFRRQIRELERRRESSEELE